MITDINGKDTIWMKVYNDDFEIEVEMPPKINFLKAALKATMTHKAPEEYDINPFKPTPPIALMKIKGVRKIFERLEKQLGGYSAETWNIDNITNMEHKPQALTHTEHITQTQGIDRKSLDTNCREMLEDIHRKNVRAILVHVRGNLSNEDNTYVIDRISRDFNCTVLKYFTKESTMVTKIDVILFGTGIRKRPEWMLF